MIYDALIAPFIEFSFMRRALIGSLAIAIGTAPIGVFLLLRRMSLMGDAMAHAVLPGVAIGYLISGLSLVAMTIGGIAAGLLVVLGSGAISRVTVLKEDATLAAFHLVALALGVVIISSSGSAVDLFHVLFGSVLALNDAALTLLCTVATLTLVTLAALYRPLVLECVDPNFLRSVSGLSAVTHYAFLALVVLNLVGAFQALGTLMAVGMMIVPAAAARLWVRDVSFMIIVAVAIGALSSIAGLIVSFHFAIETGPLIILIAGGIYGVSLLIAPVLGSFSIKSIGVTS
ncbi:MAG: metal ABC transporter permease [Pseudomonadota bacterium]